MKAPGDGLLILCISFVIIKLKIEGQTKYRKPHRKVTKLNLKFDLILPGLA